MGERQREAVTPAPRFRALVFSDFQRYREIASPTWPQVLARAVFHPGLLACILLRAQQTLHAKKQVRLAYLLRTIGVMLFSADFVPGVQVGTGLYLPHPMGVVMGAGVRIGDNVTILQGVTAGTRTADLSQPQEFATIADGATLYANVVLIGGVTVGQGAVVGANSVVTRDIPPNSVAVGAPARVVSGSTVG
jgi:serine O-acetyltransferase